MRAGRGRDCHRLRREVTAALTTSTRRLSVPYGRKSTTRLRAAPRTRPDVPGPPRARHLRLQVRPTGTTPRLASVSPRRGELRPAAHPATHADGSLNADVRGGCRHFVRPDPRTAPRSPGEASGTRSRGQVAAAVVRRVMCGPDGPDVRDRRLLGHRALRPGTRSAPPPVRPGYPGACCTSARSPGAGRAPSPPRPLPGRAPLRSTRGWIRRPRVCPFRGLTLFDLFSIDPRARFYTSSTPTKPGRTRNRHDLHRPRHPRRQPPHPRTYPAAATPCAWSTRRPAPCSSPPVAPGRRPPPGVPLAPSRPLGRAPASRSAHNEWVERDRDRQGGAPYLLHGRDCGPRPHREGSLAALSRAQ